MVCDCVHGQYLFKCIQIFKLLLFLKHLTNIVSGAVAKACPTKHLHLIYSCIWFLIVQKAKLVEPQLAGVIHGSYLGHTYMGHTWVILGSYLGHTLFKLVLDIHFEFEASVCLRCLTMCSSGLCRPQLTSKSGTTISYYSLYILIYSKALNKSM